MVTIAANAIYTKDAVLPAHLVSKVGYISAVMYRIVNECIKPISNTPISYSVFWFHRIVNLGLLRHFK